MNEFGDSSLINSISFSEREQEIFLSRLFELWKWQTEKYNGLDSTSIQVEKAQELLMSLVYTLFVEITEDGITKEMILKDDLHNIIRRGQKILETKRKLIKQKWGEMYNSAPQIQNIYFVETLGNLANFFKRYDIYYFAHQIPCSIDYPLIISVPESVQGISYIEEYIKRVAVENIFLNSFDKQVIIRLFESSIVNYKESFFNMCEIVFINAIGRTLVNKEIYPLDISDEDRENIIFIVKDKTADEILEIIACATEKICRKIFCNKNHDLYFQQVAKDLSIRISCLENIYNLSHIFVSFLPDGILRAKYDEK